MKTKNWKYWRISRSKCEGREDASRRAPRGYEHHTTTAGEYVFRKRLPDHVLESR